MELDRTTLINSWRKKDQQIPYDDWNDMSFDSVTLNSVLALKDVGGKWNVSFIQAITVTLLRFSVI